MAQLADCIEENKEVISGMRGYSALLDDLADERIPRPLADNLIAKNLLTNGYGTIVDSALCLHFRENIADHRLP